MDSIPLKIAFQQTRGYGVEAGLEEQGPTVWKSEAAYPTDTKP